MRAGPLRASDDAEESTAGQIVARGAPPWLVSLLAHCLLILILAVIAFRADPSLLVRLQADFSERIGEQQKDDSVEIDAEEPVEEVEQEVFVPLDEPEVEEPLAAAPVPERTDTNTGPIEYARVDMAMSLRGRERGRREALLKAYGGDAQTEGAVEAALRWLAGQQRQLGWWSLKGRNQYRDGGSSENPLAATAMAMLAFQGAGHTHLEGEYRDNMQRAVSWLLKQQADGYELDNTRGGIDGGFFDNPDRPPGQSRVWNDLSFQHRMYTNALCTLALCELYAMTEDSEIRESAQRGINYLLRMQTEQGGWRYIPRRGSDLSVSGWCAMALQSARIAGLSQPAAGLKGFEGFLESVTIEGGYRYTYQPIGSGPMQATSALMAEGLLCRQYLGWDRYDERLMHGVEELLSRPIDFQKSDVYYWYFATQVLHHYGGEEWWQWNDVMKRELVAHQEKEGKEAGSWDPRGDRRGHNEGGRLFMTCFCTYMLEVYYRHLPLYAPPGTFATW